MISDEVARFNPKTMNVWMWMPCGLKLQVLQQKKYCRREMLTGKLQKHMFRTFAWVAWKVHKNCTLTPQVSSCFTKAQSCSNFLQLGPKVIAIWTITWPFHYFLTLEVPKMSNWIWVIGYICNWVLSHFSILEIWSRIHFCLEIKHLLTTFKSQLGKNLVVC